MSTSPFTEVQLHAWLDGELPPDRQAELEAWLAQHPEEAARLSAYRRHDALIRGHFDPVLEEPVPPRLTGRRRIRDGRLLRYAAVLVWFALGGIAGWYVHDLSRTEASRDLPPWARRAAVAHAVYAPEVRHPVEVTADQESHLVAWLSKRLGTKLQVPHLEPVGYGLVGGRLLPGEDGAVAQFMYQDGQGQRLTLYVRTNREQNKETAFRFAQDGNVGVFYWVDRRLGYALSGEISKQELLRVATAVYQQLNP
ncbi:MAG: anti-sigma factor family protein [Burkholderiales bacterium]